MKWQLYSAEHAVQGVAMTVSIFDIQCIGSLVGRTIYHLLLFRVGENHVLPSTTENKSTYRSNEKQDAKVI